MAEFVSKFVQSLRKIDRFAVLVIQNGLRLSVGLIMLSALFYVLAGHFGSYQITVDCARGALQTAPALFTSFVIAALISDLAIKDRQAG